MNRLLAIIGILGTAGYALALHLFMGIGITEIRSLPPNELGDFLAGVFGPIAILWLILGFFQQGIELRQNTKVLELQAEELRRSVEQQQLLAKTSREQLETELKALQLDRERHVMAVRPRFRFRCVSTSYDGTSAKYSAEIENLGNHATDIRFEFTPAVLRPSYISLDSWEKNDRHTLSWSYKTPSAEEITTLRVFFVDASGEDGMSEFQLVPVPGDHPRRVQVKTT
jgi:hypothetical protein